jgi:hypothetical protein
MTTDDFKDKAEHDHEQGGDHQIADAASRARNQTVMLTPEVTGQVRALLNKNSGQKSGGDPLSELLPPASSSWEAQPHAPVAKPVDQCTTTVFSTEALNSSKPVFGMNSQQAFGAAPVEPGPAPQHPMTQVQPQATVAVAPQPQAVPAPQPVAERKSRIVGFLVSFDNDDNGEVFEIGAGRWLVTSRATEHGEFILIADETISPLHAIVRATKNGSIQILDQLSEYGTGVTPPGEEEEEEITGTMITVDHGSLVRFGKRNFVVCMVPQVDVWKGND